MADETDMTDPAIQQMSQAMAPIQHAIAVDGRLGQSVGGGGTMSQGDGRMGQPTMGQHTAPMGHPLGHGMSHHPMAPHLGHPHMGPPRMSMG